VLSYEQAEGRVRFAFTDRWGGVSSPPHDGLNLALHVGDDPVAVQIAWMDQVHGRSVAVVDGPAQVPPVADALVTRTPGLGLAVLVADCTPVLVADAAGGVVGVAHAGRKGLALGVVPELLAVMRSLGAGALSATVGPSICPRCYPVPAALRDEVAAVVPEAASVAHDGSPSLDVAGGVVAQLAAAGVTVQRVAGCSAEDPALFSYRRDAGSTGRYAGFAWLS
jgi:YfiH family protein